MNRIAIVIGVRPHFVKLSSLYPHLKEENHVTVIHTGQHFDYKLSDIFFNEFELPTPDYSLGIGSGTHAEQTGTAIIELERIFIEARPDIVLVIGDANSSLSGALAAAKLGIPIGHIEAGARNNDLKMPEEINRLAIDSISTFFFCSSQNGIASLRARGFQKNIFFTGDLLVDSIVRHEDRMLSMSTIAERFSLVSNDFCLVTIHRQSNTSDPRVLTELIDTILQLDTQVVFPLHPRTRNILLKLGLFDSLANNARVSLQEPLGYLDTISLIKHSKFVLSDSNGIQREAYFLQTPCVILRNDTEYEESVSSGCAFLAGTRQDKILQSISTIKKGVANCNYQGELGDG